MYRISAVIAITAFFFILPTAHAQCVGELGSVVDSSHGFNEGGFVERFSVSPPVQIIDVGVGLNFCPNREIECINDIGTDEARMEYDIIILAADGPGESPGTLLHRITTETVNIQTYSSEGAYRFGDPDFLYHTDIQDRNVIIADTSVYIGIVYSGQQYRYINESFYDHPGPVDDTYITGHRYAPFSWSYWGNDMFPNRRINITASVEPPPSETPVVLIHGLASSAMTWDEIGMILDEHGLLYGGEPIYDPGTGFVLGISFGEYYQMNFSDYQDDPPSQNLTLAQQGAELGTIVAGVRQVNCSVSTVRLVGHSMGGLAARSYMQNLAEDVPYRGDVEQLITVGTPHQGSYWAFVCSNYPGFCSASDIHSDSIAVQELEPGSSSLIELNDLFKNPLPVGVGHATIVGLGQDTYAGGTSFEPGDGIVTQDSQDPPFFIPPWETVELQVGDCGKLFLHTCETRDQGIQNKILQLIGLNVFSDGFESGDISAWNQ